AVHAGGAAQQGGAEAVEQPEDIRHALAGAHEYVEVPGPGGGVRDAGEDALHVAHAAHGADELRAAEVVGEELLHGGVAADDLGQGEQGPLHPGAEHPPAHGGLGEVQHAQQAAVLVAVAHGLGELKAPAGDVVELHAAAALDDIEAADVLHVAALGIGDVGEQRARGAHGALAAVEAELPHVGAAEAAQQQRLGRAGLEEPVLALAHAGELGGEEVRHPPALLRAGGEYGLVGRKAAQLVYDVLLGG